MTTNGINQTRVVHNYISYDRELTIESPALSDESFKAAQERYGEDNMPAEHFIENYEWFLVSELDGTEDHVVKCLGSTWVGVLPQ